MIIGHIQNHLGIIIALYLNISQDETKHRQNWQILPPLPQKTEV